MTYSDAELIKVVCGVVGTLFFLGALFSSNKEELQVMLSMGSVMLFFIWVISFLQLTAVAEMPSILPPYQGTGGLLLNIIGLPPVIWACIYAVSQAGFEVHDG